jgi:hypothetical protein
VDKTKVGDNIHKYVKGHQLSLYPFASDGYDLFITRNCIVVYLAREKEKKI